VVVVTGSSEIITITLNGLTVSGSPGMTILDLARESGIEIPTLCSDTHLQPIGACRICLVQDERNGNLFASCVTPISPGMVINTNSDQVIEHRKNVIELMLASHPDTCMVCDKANRCQLRQIASELGIGLTRLYKTPQLSIIQELNPYIERDLTKCILCGKCIRACQEMVVEGAIDYYERGFIAKPATFNDLALENSECTFCGTCVSLCPTGALSEKLKTYRSSTATSISTICPFCACGCLLNIETKDDSIVRVKPGSSYSVNSGTACKWGSYHLDFISNPERLTIPLIKIEDHFEESSWEIALGLIADKLNEIKKAHGPDSVAVLASPNCTNEDNYVLQRFGRNIIGTNNIDSSSYYFPFNASANNDFLTSGLSSPIKNIEKADLIVIIGADPENTAPIVSYAIKRAARFKKTKLINIYPVETRLTEFSTICLYPEWGIETALINGFIKKIINKEKDTGKLAASFSNYDRFIDTLNIYTSSYTAKNTNVISSQLESASRLIFGSKHPIFIIDAGNVNYGDSFNFIKAVENLLLILNILNSEPCYYINLQRFCNSLGMKDMGISPHFLPGYQSLSDPEVIKKFNNAWNTKLPSKKGKSFIEITSQARDKKGILHALYIAGENPVINCPSDLNITQFLSDLDFMVVQDLFLTETAKLANVILPAASFAEKTGTFTNLEGKIQKLNRVFNPTGECLPDWEIFVHLSRKIQPELPYKSLREIMEEIDKLVPLYHDYSSIVESQNLIIDTLNVRNEYPFKDIEKLNELAVVGHKSEKHAEPSNTAMVTDIRKSTYFGTGTRTAKSSRFIQSYEEKLVLSANNEETERISGTNTGKA
jgi:formate dehydrogenase alpha subunit